MLKSLIRRIENRSVMRVSNNADAQEMMVLGKVMLEDGRMVEIANVLRFPAIDMGFSTFTVEQGSILAGSASEPVHNPIIGSLKKDAYHLMVRQGHALRNVNVLATFPDPESGSLALRQLVKRSGKKIPVLKIIAIAIALLILLFLISVFNRPSSSAQSMARALEERSAQRAMSAEMDKRAATVGSDLQGLSNQGGQGNDVPTTADSSGLLGSGKNDGMTGSAPDPVKGSDSRPAGTAPAAQQPAQQSGNFGFQ